MTTDLALPDESEERPREKKSFEIITILVEKVSGTVKWFSAPRRYGFIQRDDNNEDVFVHRNSITASNQRYPTLRSGESVEFSIVETVSGINADSVTGPEGKPVKGFFRRFNNRARNPSKPELSDAPLADSSIPQQNQPPPETQSMNGPRRFVGRRRGGSDRPHQQYNQENAIGYEVAKEDESREGVSPSDGAPLPRPRPRRGRGRNMRRGFLPSGPRPVSSYDHLGNDGYVQQQRRPPGRGRRFSERGRRLPMHYENSPNHKFEDNNRTDLETEQAHKEEYPLEVKMENLALKDLEETPHSSVQQCENEDTDKQPDEQEPGVEEQTTTPIEVEKS